MRLTVIGCSGSFPGPESPASCYLIEVDGHRTLLDLGTGAIGALARHTDIYAIDAILLSHLHPDHFFDVCSLYVAHRFHPDGGRPAIPLHGPAGTADRLRAAYGDDAMDVAAQFEVTEWVEGTTYDVGPLRVSIATVVHPVPCFAIRVDHGGGSLVYSGDTAPSARLAELATGADLLLCEASWQEGRDNPPGLHLTGRDAAQHAQAAGVRRLVLTHIPPWNDPALTLEEARPWFHGPIELARSGVAYDL